MDVGVDRGKMKFVRIDGSFDGSKVEFKGMGVGAPDGINALVVGEQFVPFF